MAKRKCSTRGFPSDYYEKDDMVGVGTLQQKVKSLKNAIEKVFPPPCGQTDKSKDARVPVPLSAKGGNYRGYRMGAIKTYNEIQRHIKAIYTRLPELGVQTTTMGYTPPPLKSAAPAPKGGKKGKKKGK